MAIQDALAAWVFSTSPLSLVAAAGVDVPTNPIDLMGDGVGTTVRNIWGNSTLPFSPDARGVGSPLPLIDIIIGTALSDGTGTPLLTAELQGAEDNGSGSPGSYQTYVRSAALTSAQGTAGQRIRLPFVPPFPLTDRPRFLRLNFEIPAGTTFATGTILSAAAVFPRDDWYVGQQPRNYTVGPLA
jgi:hypothetical protein